MPDLRISNNIDLQNTPDSERHDKVDLMSMSDSDREQLIHDIRERLKARIHEKNLSSLSSQARNFTNTRKEVSSIAGRADNSSEELNECIIALKKAINSLTR